MKILKSKKSLRILKVKKFKKKIEQRTIFAGTLIQDFNNKKSTIEKIFGKNKLKKERIDFFIGVLKYIKSNAILIAKDCATLSVGAGQVSRVDSVDIALGKLNGSPDGAVLFSDAFFPFRDSIDRIAQAGIKSIVQPGGSVKDREVIDACDEFGIAMLFTGSRCFRH